MSEALPELVQFRYSHFNEKARWGFDWKGIAHRRRTLLPGPHMLSVRRLTGATQVPVVRFPDAVVSGSARILLELDRRHPERPLHPEEPAERERALEIQRYFDEEVGPCVRRSLFGVLLEELDYLALMFAGHRGRLAGGAYRASLSAVGRVMRDSMGITGPDSIEQATQTTDAAFAYLEKHVGASGYLVGDRFSVADLAAAALLAPVASPPGSQMERPSPEPTAVREWSARWADREGFAWVREIYARHRPEPLAGD